MESRRRINARQAYLKEKKVVDPSFFLETTYSLIESSFDETLLSRNERLVDKVNDTTVVEDFFEETIKRAKHPLNFSLAFCQELLFVLNDIEVEKCSVIMTTLSDRKVKLRCDCNVEKLAKRAGLPLKIRHPWRWDDEEAEMHSVELRHLVRPHLIEGPATFSWTETDRNPMDSWFYRNLLNETW